MALPVYLAMTAAEMEGCASLPVRCGWMACHFSPYGLGLSNVPAHLPEGSMLILNDRTPVHGHDPEVVTRQMQELAKRHGLSGVLLDFQRPGCRETAAIAAAVVSALACPVGVTECYAEGLDCPVFLDAPPPHHPLVRHTAPWEGRELWLEAALNCGCVTVTRDGSRYSSCRDAPEDGIIHREETLHCHYRTTVREEEIRFTLWRTREDLQDLLAEAESLGITRNIGLYQELGAEPSPP